MDSLVKFDVETFLLAWDEEVVPEFLAEFADELDTFLQSFSSTSHTNVFPHDVTKFLMYRVNAALTLDVHKLVDAILNGLLPYQ